MKNVLLVARWKLYVTDREASQVHRNLVDTISALKGSDARIWIMKSVPQHRWNVPRALASTVFFGGDAEQIGLTLKEHRENSELESQNFEGVSAPGVTVLDPTDLFVSPNDLCRVAAGGNALYFDNHHLTTSGAMLLRPLFEPIFRGIESR